MWIMTSLGFFSIVQKPDDLNMNTLTIRSRAKEDLEALRENHLPGLGPIESGAGTDYRYRAKADRSDVAAAFQALILKITYENFKNVVKARQGIKRAEIYHNVWRELCEIEYLPTLPRAYGGLLIDADGRVLLCKPRGEYDGYVWTFPKGRPETGEADTECALREVREETGYQAQITGKIFGSYESESSATEYFLMHPVGTPENFGPETEAICWVTLDEARQKVQETRNVAGQKRDLSVLKQLLEMK